MISGEEKGTWKPVLKEENNLCFYSILQDIPKLKQILQNGFFHLVAPLSLAPIGDPIILQLCLMLAPHWETQNVNQYMFFLSDPLFFSSNKLDCLSVTSDVLKVSN